MLFVWTLTTTTLNNFRWKVLKASVNVNVAEGNTELPPRSLIIKGYDVTGFVKADGEPVKDVHIIISTVSKILLATIKKYDLMVCFYRPNKKLL